MKVKVIFSRLTVLFLPLLGLLFYSCSDDDDDNPPVVKMKYPVSMNVITHNPTASEADTVWTSFAYNANNQLTEMLVISRSKTVKDATLDTITHTFNYSASTQLLESEILEKNARTLSTYNYTYYTSEDSNKGLLHTRALTTHAGNVKTTGDIETFYYNSNKTIQKYTRINKATSLNQRTYLSYSGTKITKVIDTLTTAPGNQIRSMDIKKDSSPSVYNSFFRKLYGDRMAITGAGYYLGTPFASYFEKLPAEAEIITKSPTLDTKFTQKHVFDKLLDDGFPEKYRINNVTGNTTVLFQEYNISYNP